GKNHTRIASEKNFVTGEALSTISGVSENGTATSTETRGDGAIRTFHYYSVERCIECPPPDTDSCSDPGVTDGKLQSYTDFLDHTTTLAYETDTSKLSAGFITAVTDPNNH